MFEVAYEVIGRNGQLLCKRRSFKTGKARERFGLARLVKSDNFTASLRMPDKGEKHEQAHCLPR